jgi:glycine betaine/proline transport system ATP-binding protein
MVSLGDYVPATGEDLTQSPRAHHGTDLDQLIDISTTTEFAVVITDDDGNDVGVVNKSALLSGIKGGKA